MNRRMMKSKIHRATVTDAHLDYVGSISLDPHLLKMADILVGEQLHILDIDNGARFETYAIEGRPGEVCLNGAAARLVHPGDKVIIISYADYNEEEVAKDEPLVVHVDDNNRPLTESAVRELLGGPVAAAGGATVSDISSPRPLRGSSVPPSQ